MTPVRLEPAVSRSRSKHSTTEPLRSRGGGPNVKTFFLMFFFFEVDEGIEDPNIKVIGPSSARQRNAI